MPISKIGSKGVKDAEISAADIAPGTITTDKIAPGTIANDRLAGSIANAKLANSNITINGTSINLGASGSIVAGTDWQSVKTANFTAVAGEGYACNTTGGSFTMTFPASPSVGDTIEVVDYAGTFATNALVLNRNGSNIQGDAANGSVGLAKQAISFVYIDATKGWIPVNDNAAGDYGAGYVAATGGTVSTSGDYKIHTFNSSSNFVVSFAGNSAGSNSVDYMVVAGGAGGGQGCAGGGGGAGGYRTNYPQPDTGGLAVSAQTYPITVGAGGAGGTSHNDRGDNGSNSVFSTITSAGGGGGAASPNTGGDGGSGGGGSHSSGTGGSGNTPPVSPPQGNAGGASVPSGSPDDAAGGGGGSGGVGAPGHPSGPNGDGGAGTNNAITGSTVSYAGGGGGSMRDIPNALGGSRPLGHRCAGGGGVGGNNPASKATGVAGLANAGSGGGGGARIGPFPSPPGSMPGAAGGSGVVVIRYRYQA